MNSNLLGAIQLELQLHFVLQSDATFGRGAALLTVAALVDREIDHDADGLPLLRGRALKGLLNESAADILYSLQQIWGADSSIVARWQRAAARLGGPGSDHDSQAWVDYGDASLPPPLRAAIQFELHERREQRKPPLQPSHFLNALTAIRRQTAMNEWGVPVAASLRAQHVLLRETPFVATLTYFPKPLRPQDETASTGAQSPSAQRQADDLALLAAAIKGWERAGSARNRGLGRLKAGLHDGNGGNITAEHFARFADALKEERVR